MLASDPDDDWTRLRGELHKRRNDAISGVIGGGLAPEQYASSCGRIAQIDDVLELIKTVRRGEDLRPPVREPLKSPEE